MTLSAGVPWGSNSWQRMVSARAPAMAAADRPGIVRRKSEAVQRSGR